jgi:hypothetical protein
MAEVTSRALKLKHERSIFVRFCAAAGFQIVRGTLRQPDPPAPDVIVELNGAGRIAFELVRLDDSEELMGYNLLQQAIPLIDEEFDALPIETRSVLVKCFANAEITIEFRHTATVVERRRALPLLWNALLKLADRANGQLALHGQAEKKVITFLFVARAELKARPRFISSALGYPLPIRVERVTAKLKRKYDCCEPLELLAYQEIGQLSYRRDEESLRVAIDRHIQLSQFRRVWIYEERLRRVTLVFTHGNTDRVR